ncbi:MAG TPA: type II CAAX endopeptidase family protein [Bryobacteraceae bacterium]|nr:type II CAAX endopeptidase family protein [Bryobacteraceae bacterium]
MEKPFWGYLDLLIFFGLAVGALFLIIFALGGLVRFVPSLRDIAQLIALPLQLVLYILLFVALWMIIRVKYDRPIWRSLGWTASRIPLWQALIGGGVLSIVVGLLGAAMRTPQIKSPFDRFLHSPLWIAMFGLFAILLGPFFEELVFRGFIQPLLARDLGNAAGILITAAVFGLLHAPEYSGSWQYVILIVFAGACFGYARFWGRSLIPAIVMHSGFNTVFFVAALVGTQYHK